MQQSKQVQLWRLVIALMLVAVSHQQTRGQLSSLPPLPWPNTHPLTISFAPDFVEIGRFRSELYMHLDSQLSYPDWKIEILRAFQTWARYSDLQPAVVPDSPRAFGVPGLSQGDPRFGDIRIGAFPQTHVLGNAVAFHPAAGSWAGDIFLDTTREFYIHDWSQSPPADQYDLFSVMLHEAGNALGLLDEIVDMQSVMFFAYVGPRADLNSLDIANIQALYGPPTPDPYEPPTGNESFASATPIDFPRHFPQTLIASTSGRIQHAGDVDVYRFVGTELSANCWIKLRARGRSLLCGRITAYDAQYQEIATQEAENPLHNNAIKEITNIDPGEVIYVVVEWSGYPDFEFGEYELVLDFNEHGGDEEEEGDDDDPEDRFWEAGDEDLVDLLYSLHGLVDMETNTNNTFAKAVKLFSSFGFPEGSRFEVLSAIASPTDVDMYRIVASPSATGTMAIDLAPLGIDPALLDIRVFNANQKSMSVKKRFRSTGDVVAEVNNIQPNATYYVQVRNRTGNTLNGNYLLMINLADRSIELERIQTLNLSAAQPDRFGSFMTYKTQLFRFDLSMTSPNNNNQAVQLTIYSDTGRNELVTSVRSGRKTVVYVWLNAGEHYVRFTAKTRNGATILNSTVVLDGASISDDEGPVLIDPSGNPTSGPQGPGNSPTPPPTWDFPIVYTWLFELIVPPENPW